MPTVCGIGSAKVYKGEIFANMFCKIVMGQALSYIVSVNVNQADYFWRKIGDSHPNFKYRTSVPGRLLLRIEVQMRQCRARCL